MSQVFTGQDMLDNRISFTDLPDEFFTLLDPSGLNVVQEVYKHGAEYRCVVLCKFRDRTTPFEAYITFPENVYDSITSSLDLEALTKGVN